MDMETSRLTGTIMKAILPFLSLGSFLKLRRLSRSTRERLSIFSESTSVSEVQDQSGASPFVSGEDYHIFMRREAFLMFCPYLVGGSKQTFAATGSEIMNPFE